MGPRSFHAAAACLALATATATAQAPGALDPEAALAEGGRAEEALDFDRALALYEAGARAGVGERAGRRARFRADHLRERRAPDGSFDDLAAFEEMRRMAPEDMDEGRRQAFARAAEGMEAEVVRADSLFLLGEAYLRRLGDPGAAIPFYEAVIASPAVGLERRRTAAVGLADARAAAGDPAVAVTVLEEAGLGGSFEAEGLRSAEGRRWARAGAGAALILSLLFILVVGRPQMTLVAAARALRRRHLFAALYVLIVPACIAALYDREVIGGFVFFAVGAAGLLFAAFASGRSLRARSAPEVTFAVVFGAVVVALGAVAWLSLDAVDGLALFGFP